jgi:hypothetical protein
VHVREVAAFLLAHPHCCYTNALALACCLPLHQWQRWQQRCVCVCVCVCAYVKKNEIIYIYMRMQVYALVPPA